ncbi:hypothetical protein B0H16DRAFT_1311066 [Mycena metata]|uniref:ribonuclease H n=1 Tax=Mycena metata TaxID=1033252 RepID=A0AAD7JFP1_9AGAR|nr:hypothetical protein B0H16DRAFT_1311066 [Mycena metata]
MEGLAISREIQRSAPIWFHQKSTATRTLFTRGQHHKKTVKCLKETHKIVSVSDAEVLARLLQTSRHQSAWNCRCAACTGTRHTHPQCEDPNACFRRAKLMVDSLLPKWNPMLPQPEDWEAGFNVDAPQDPEAKVFNPKVTTYGTLADTFRIFTERIDGGDVAPDNKPDSEPDEEEIIAHTDGSANNNGRDEVTAGSGVFFGQGDIRNIAVRVPVELNPSNQVAEILAIKQACETCPIDIPLTIISDSRYSIDGLTRICRVGRTKASQPYPMASQYRPPWVKYESARRKLR